jgi:PilZ domain
MSDERRQYPRYAVVGLQGRLAGRHPFEVVSVSLSGLLLDMGHEPPLGQIFDLEVPLPETLFHAAVRVVFLGEDRVAPGHRRHRVGVAFAQGPQEEGSPLHQFISRELDPRSETESP